MKRFIEQYRAGEINSLGQEKQTDEKAASGLGALIASALSSLIPKNKTEEVQTLEIKNAGDLKNAYPDMVNQITADAVTVERGRVTALDAIDDPSNAAVHELVVDAKASGKTAEDIKSAVDIMKKHTADADAKNKGAEAMKKVVNDSKASGVDGVDADAGEGQSEQQETAAVVNTMAGVLNKMGGKK